VSLRDMKYFYCYLIFISFLSVLITCYDKFASKKIKKHRAPEAVLFLLAAFGGSAAMLFTMLAIRHKTKHKRFMLGIPLIMLAQAALIFIAYRNHYWEF